MTTTDTAASGTEHAHGQLGHVVPAWLLLAVWGALVVFTVVGMTLEFLKPARLDDLLQVRSAVKLAGGASVQFEQQILRESEPILAATVRVACLDASTFRPRRVPAAVRGSLE